VRTLSSGVEALEHPLSARAEAPDPGWRQRIDERLERVGELGGGGPVGRARLEAS